MSITEKIFVYGTLRPPQPNTPAHDSRYHPQIEPYLQASAPAQVNQADLYNVGAYPAARPGKGTIYGDLLSLKPPALKITDRIEGHPHFFRREKVAVLTETGPEKAWIYWASPGLVIGKRPITCGDWFQRNQAECQEQEAGPEKSKLDEPEEVDTELQRLLTRFAEADCCWFSSVRADGRAHSTPIWHVWYQGRVYVITMPRAVKTKNIAENPSVVITHPDPVNPIIIEGWATLALDLQAQLQPLFQAKYNWDISTDTDYRTIIEITPTKLMAWGTHGQGRWPGEAVRQIALPSLYRDLD